MIEISCPNCGDKCFKKVILDNKMIDGPEAAHNLPTKEPGPWTWFCFTYTSCDQGIGVIYTEPLKSLTLVEIHNNRELVDVQIESAREEAVEALRFKVTEILMPYFGQHLTKV